MKQLFAAFFFASLFFVGCAKHSKSDPQTSCAYDSCSLKAPASEIQQVQAYLASNNITATQHCSGLFYHIDNPGSGSNNPKICSVVTVRYKGMLTNGTVFEENQSSNKSAATAYLGQFIPGWVNGIPYIKAGGKIQLYIPPTLAYGNTASGSIPANSILIFEVDLITVL